MAPLEGIDWESHCRTLLSIRYQPPSPFSFQAVPAAHGGDCGIEGFSTDGVLYQCYGPDSYIPIKDRYERQREKLHDEIDSVIKRQVKLKAIIGDLVVRRYCLLVPRHDSKELVAYAKTRELLVRDAGIDFIDPGFQVLIMSEDDFPIEREQALRSGVAKLSLDQIGNDHPGLESFLSESTDRVQTLREKLSKAIPGGATSERVEGFIRAFLRGDTISNDLYEKSPAGFETLREIRMRRESNLEMHCMISPLDPLPLLDEIRRTFLSDLEDELIFVRSADLESISNATVVEWLMDCPINFVDV